MKPTIFKLPIPIFIALVASHANLLLFDTNYYNVYAQQQDDDPNLQSINDTRFESILNHDSYALDELHEHARCQPMNIPFCENVDYNRTILPNFLGHQTQQDVISEINVYHPLLRVSCSPDLKLFLCTVYAPICFDHVNESKPLSLFPCRSLCESARQGCSAHLKQFNSEWPPALHCDKFPEKNKDKSVICVGKDDDTRFSTLDTGEFAERMIITRELSFVCPKNFEVDSYTLQLNGKSYNNCAMPCDDVLLDKNSARIVRITTGIFSILCIISTLITCVIFLIDTKRFDYPERPVIIIAFCQLIVAVCYFIGFLTSNRISCNDPADPPKNLPNMKMIRTSTMGNKKGSCTLQFMALYFFQMSTVFWWLMMTVSWFMIAGLKYTLEAVNSISRVFHLISWTVPALLTVYLTVLGNIEGDSLTGTCFVKISDLESTMKFVIYPILFCVSLGLLLFPIGCRLIKDSRDMFARQFGKQTDQHSTHIVGIGIFFGLFIIFSLTLAYCHYYELRNHNAWKLSWLSSICKNREYSIPCPVKNYTNQAPHYSTFIFKSVATMAIGIISPLFILSEKTFSDLNFRYKH